MGLFLHTGAFLKENTTRMLGMLVSPLRLPSLQGTVPLPSMGRCKGEGQFALGTVPSQR
jgi:hypothetical protein